MERYGRSEQDTIPTEVGSSLYSSIHRSSSKFTEKGAGSVQPFSIVFLEGFLRYVAKA